ncbi:MAG TPA: LysM peptidoglycan-binding domain-containing protein [Phycisphaerales bacterium]|nr:LysM peptidoglycan-binding domain-containing protein [Phycisphaerales bacterium]
MTRELKLALIVGFLLVLLVSVLIADHLSTAKRAQLDTNLDQQPPVVMAQTAAAQEPAPIVSINQGRNGGIAMNGEPLASEPMVLDNPGQDRSIVQNIGERAGEVLSGDRVMPPGMSTATVPVLNLSQNRLPVIETPSGDPQFAARDAQARIEPVSDKVIPFGGAGPLIAQDGIRLGGEPQGERSAAEVQGVSQPDTQLLIQPLPVKQDARTQPQRRTADAGEQSHVVANGESAYSIAKKYYGKGEHWRKLLDANADRMGKNGSVRVGVRLRVPSAESLGIKTATPTPKTKTDQPREQRVAKSDADKAPKAGKPSKGDKPAGGRQYVVKKGDSLSIIAQRELGTMKRVNEIMRLNNLSNPGAIRVGDRLVLPAA